VRVGSVFLSEETDGGLAAAVVAAGFVFAAVGRWLVAQPTNNTAQQHAKHQLDKRIMI